jgi:hypothetical protein
MGVPVGESNSPLDRRSSDEPPLVPPPEWGKETSPLRGKIISVVAVCIAVAAGIAIWRFDLFGSEDASGDDRQDSEQDIVASPSTTVSVPEANLANVGDCVRITKDGLDGELEIVECGAAAAMYKVVLELETPERCPAGPYAEYAAMGIGGWSLCLALNAKVGQCFRNSADGFTRTECASADFKVTKVLANAAGENACPPPPPNALFHPEPLVYPTPPLTICLAGIKT